MSEQPKQQNTKRCAFKWEGNDEEDHEEKDACAKKKWQKWKWLFNLDARTSEKRMKGSNRTTYFRRAFRCEERAAVQVEPNERPEVIGQGCADELVDFRPDHWLLERPTGICIAGVDRVESAKEDEDENKEEAEEDEKEVSDVGERRIS